MKKNSTWNKLFHNKELQKENEQFKVYQMRKAFEYEVLKNLEDAQSLVDVFDIHKDAWTKCQFQHPNIGPCPWGIYRCESIPTMKLDEVYLGGVWGLSTRSIPFWELHKDEPIGCNGFGIKKNVLLYTLVLNQYKNQLRSNVRAMAREATEMVDKYIKAGYIPLVQR